MVDKAEWCNGSTYDFDSSGESPTLSSAVMSSILYDFTPAELQNLLNTSDSYSDILRKVGLNPKGRNPDTLKEIIKKYNLDETKLNENRKLFFCKCGKSANVNKYDLEDILNNKYPKYQSSKLLIRLIKVGLKNNECEICGITEWNNMPITFQLHHIDGNHYNNELNNLQVLCPNCHSQTDTFSGNSSKKNNKKVKDKHEKKKSLPPITREELKIKIRCVTFVSIAKEYGVTDNAIRKWCDKYHLPRKSSVIHNYSDEEWELI